MTKLDWEESWGLSMIDEVTLIRVNLICKVTFVWLETRNRRLLTVSRYGQTTWRNTKRFFTKSNSSFSSFKNWQKDDFSSWLRRDFDSLCWEGRGGIVFNQTLRTTLPQNTWKTLWNCHFYSCFTRCKSLNHLVCGLGAWLTHNDQDPSFV